MEENKISRSKLIKGAIAIIAVLVIAIGLFVFAGESKTTFKKLKGTPDEVLVAAFSNTDTKCADEQAEMDVRLGRTQANKLLSKTANEMNFNLVLQGISGGDSTAYLNTSILNAYIKDMGLSGRIQSTNDYQKVNGDLKLTQSGMEILGLSVYKEADEVGISIPKILDAPYAIKTSNWMQDYKESELYQLIGGEEISEEDFNEVIDVFSAFREYMTGAASLAENEAYMQQVKELQAQFVKDAKIVEKGKENITLLDGQETQWQVYSGTLSGKELIDFLNKQVELVMSLDFAKNYFEMMAEQSGYTVDEMLEEMKVTLEEDSTATVDIDFLVDDIYFRGFRLGINEEQERIMDISMQYTGREYLLDGICVNIVALDEEESGIIDVTFNQNLGEKTDAYYQNLEVSMDTEGAEEVNIGYTYEYNKQMKEDNLKVGLDIVVENMNLINYIATGTKTVNDQEVTTNLSNASVTIQDETESYTLDFGLGYGIKAIDASDIVIEKTGVKYLLEMTEADLLKTLQSIRTNIQSFTYGLI